MIGREILGRVKEKYGYRETCSKLGISFFIDEQIFKRSEGRSQMI